MLRRVAVHAIYGFSSDDKKPRVAEPEEGQDTWSPSEISDLEIGYRHVPDCSVSHIIDKYRCA